MLAHMWQVLCVSHPRRAEELIGNTRIEGRVTIRLINHLDTAMQIKNIRSSCIGTMSTCLSVVLLHLAGVAACNLIAPHCSEPCTTIPCLLCHWLLQASW